MNKKGLTSGHIVMWVIGLILLLLFLGFVYKLKTGTFPSVFAQLTEIIWGR